MSHASGVRGVGSPVDMRFPGHPPRRGNGPPRGCGWLAAEGEGVPWTSGLSGEPAARVIATAVEITVFTIPKYQPSTAARTAAVSHGHIIPVNLSADILDMLLSGVFRVDIGT